jgi:hypothetical protein
MVSVETISIAFTGLSVSLAAFYYISTLRNAQRTRELALKAQEQALETRQAQMFLTVYNRMLDENFMRTINDVLFNWEWRDLDDFTGKFGPDTDHYPKFNIVMMFYEGIGILVNKGLIKASLIDDFMSAGTLILWKKYSQIIYELRKYYDAPQTFEWVEYLYNQIKPIVEEQHPELKT